MCKLFVLLILTSCALPQPQVQRPKPLFNNNIWDKPVQYQKIVCAKDFINMGVKPETAASICDKFMSKSE